MRLSYNKVFDRYYKPLSDKLAEMQITTIDRYEATDGDVPSICEIKLRDSGINVEEFLKEVEKE